MKGITKEVKIGLTAVFALVVLFFGMQFLKGLNLFSDTNTYSMTFDNVNGLSTSTAIYANGVKVGNVGAIEYDYENGKGIIVEAELDKRLRVPKGTIAVIDKDLMGNMQVDLQMPTDMANILKPGDRIEGRLYSGALDAASAMVPDVQKMLPKIDSILISVNTLLANPALVQTLDNVATATSNLETASRQVTELMASINGAVPDMAAKADGILGKADGILVKADGAMANANTFTGNLAKLDVAPTMELVNTTLASTKDAMQKLNTSMNDINKLTADLNNQTGSLGKLMNDPNLYNNLSNTARSADSLLIDLKSHPKRYVHFSIFGRKDK